MPASPSPRRDPFRPPGQEERRIELGDVKARPPSQTTAAVVPSSPRSTGLTRRPLKYRRPGVSWVTVVVLGFAAVGAAAVGGVIFKKVTGLAVTPPRVALPGKPVIYQPLAKDDAVLITVTVSPRDARLVLDGEPLTSNPMRIPRGTKPHTLAAAAHPCQSPI